MNIIILIFWIFSLILIWLMSNKFFNKIEVQGRIFIYYVLVSALFLLFFKGTDFGITENYIYNLITTILGILITVTLIDTIYNYINNKKEEAYRKTALRLLKMPIYTYCINWFYLYQEDSPQNTIINENFKSLEDFFYSDDFFSKVRSFDFNRHISMMKVLIK
ncbi:hypothetical protein BN1195_02405 [Chryseobacterium oranimense G311]|uniref:hypothetical protein n=1 Tax=Chryseobacterium oranimense TaxID=421058 RepID=UPI0005336E4C|nr:hypothetical protein [Chryseobacterium oranimense]CEJ70101.1 hypothetical protein BN1195_02405 [Chryseobacterium oranimense G311]